MSARVTVLNARTISAKLKTSRLSHLALVSHFSQPKMSDDTGISRLCGRALASNCRLGSECPSFHPVDIAAALAEHGKKKTLFICGDYPNCEQKAECVFLHLEVVPPRDGGPGSAAASTPLNGSATPSRPFDGGRRERRERREPRGPPSKGARPVSDALLQRIGKKLTALLTTEEAYRMLASTLTKGAAEESRAKADQARDVRLEFLRELGELTRRFEKNIAALENSTE
jgi:hypothetical protein